MKLYLIEYSGGIMLRTKSLFLKAVFLFSIALSYNLYAGTDSLEFVEIFKSTPGKEPLMSHFPIPIVFADWEEAVTKKFGRNSLARYNEHIYRDLPPCKAELDSVPRNKYLVSLIKKDPKFAKRLIIKTLIASLELKQWSIIAECKYFVHRDFISPLMNIAESDPDKTDRAFAYKVLSHYDFNKKISFLKKGLFDNYYAIRMMCTELLKDSGDKANDIAAMIPIFTRNPFDKYFSQNAYVRLFPESFYKSLVRMPFDTKIEKLKAKYQKELSQYISMAETRNNDFSSLALILLGSESQKKQSLKKIEELLLAHGKMQDTYWSEEFWVRNDIIQVLGSADTANLNRILSLIDKHLSNYSKEKDQLLIALCSVFNLAKFKPSETTLAKIRNVDSAHPDLYLSAAMSLSRMKSKEAFPSLIAVLGSNRMPFFQMAVYELERLTRLETPGKPEKKSVLNNIGLPRGKFDFDKARDYWVKWYKGNKDNLYFDTTESIYKVK